MAQTVLPYPESGGEACVATVSESVSASQNNPVVQMIPQTRIESVDLLRGLVMVIMALDHTRESFTYIRQPPEILQLSYLALFFTRWITHFCALAFFFLAGTGAFLSASRGKKWEEVAAFLAKRGAWLILLEFTVIDFGWTFVPGMIFAGVVYALGACMLIGGDGDGCRPNGWAPSASPSWCCITYSIGCRRIRWGHSSMPG